MPKLTLLALLLAGRAAAQDALPPPPPPPTEAAPQAEAEAAAAPLPEPTPSAVLGATPLAPAGSQVAPLDLDPRSPSRWRFSLASGFIGRFGGMTVDPGEANSKAMLYLGAQADAAWREGRGRAARVRVRLMTGGEEQIFLPSDGEVEAAYLLGRKEFRFVLGRMEVGRYPSLGIQTLVQAGTLPSFEGSVGLASDRLRISYYVAPVQAAWVWYYEDAHLSQDLPGWKQETARPEAATAARLRFTTVVPPSVILSVQGDFLKFWAQPDLGLSVEGSAGYAVLDNSVLFNATIRWDSYNRRGAGVNTEKREDDVKIFAVATLAF